MKRKILLPVLLASVLALSACGAGAPSGSSSPASTGGDPSSDAGTPAGEQVTIEIFNQKAEITEHLNAIIADFEKANPNIKVTQTQIPDAGTVLNTRFASNEAPDVMSLFPNTVEYRLQVGSGYLMDLTGDAVLSEVDPRFLEDIKIDGKDYNVPLTMNGWGLFYNVAKFKELGLNPPKTWAEFEKLCADIKAAGLIPMATSFKENWTVGHIGESVFLNIAGVDKANAFFSDKTLKAQDSPEFQKLIERLDFFEANSEPDSVGTAYADAAAMFATGKALIMPQGIWALPMFAQAGMTDEVAMFPVPNDEGTGQIQFGVDFALSISAQTKHPEEAKAFVKYMASKETAQTFAKVEPSPSTIKGVVTNTPQTTGVTDLLFADGRSAPWMHFTWEAGNEGQWGTELCSYFVLHDKEAFMNNVNAMFGK